MNLESVRQKVMEGARAQAKKYNQPDPPNILREGDRDYKLDTSDGPEMSDAEVMGMSKEEADAIQSGGLVETLIDENEMTTEIKPAEKKSAVDTFLDRKKKALLDRLLSSK